MAGLKQYGIDPSPYGGAIQVTGPEPPSSFDDDTVGELLWQLIDAGQLPEPDSDGGSILYCVVVPPTASYTPKPSALGAHSYDSDIDVADSDNVWFAWIGNNSYSSAARAASAAGAPLDQASLDLLTRAFGHEVAEACTDPELDGWRVDGTDNITEIGDVCNTRLTRINGVQVEYYWSAADGACLLTTETIEAPWAIDEATPSGWQNWSPLGGPGSNASSLQVAHESDGSLVVLAVDLGRKPWHIEQSSPNGTWVANWTPLGGDGSNVSQILLRRDGTKRLHAIAADMAGGPWHIRQRDSGEWESEWSRLGGPGSNARMLLASRNHSGSLFALAIDRGDDWKPWHIQQDALGAWASEWSPLGAVGSNVQQLQIARYSDGRPVAFGIDLGGGPWVIEQDGDGVWASEWVHLGAPGSNVKELHVAVNKDGRLTLVVTDRTELYHPWTISQLAPAGPWESEWSHLGSSDSNIKSLVVDHDKAGALVVAAIDLGDKPWSIRQNTPGGPWADNWVPLGDDGSNARELRFGHNSDGSLTLFAIDLQNGPWFLREVRIGTWEQSWQFIGEMGSNVAQVLIGERMNGALMLVVRDMSDGVWFNVQTPSPANSFGPWVPLVSAPGSDNLRRARLLELGTNPDGRHTVAAIAHVAGA